MASVKNSGVRLHQACSNSNQFKRSCLSTRHNCYMRLLDIPIGLLINFHELKLVDGIHRLILPGANEP